jgi:hypothetical protein
MSRKIVIPFIRQEVTGVSAIALLEITTTRPISKETAIKGLIKIINQWVRDTEEGKKALLHTNGDFNIGDYALYERSISDDIPHSMYTKQGIKNVEILYIDSVDGAELYDRKLVE